MRLVLAASPTLSLNSGEFRVFGQLSVCGGWTWKTATVSTRGLRVSNSGSLVLGLLDTTTTPAAVCPAELVVEDGVSSMVENVYMRCGRLLFDATSTAVTMTVDSGRWIWDSLGNCTLSIEQIGGIFSANEWVFRPDTQLQVNPD